MSRRLQNRQQLEAAAMAAVAADRWIGGARRQQAWAALVVDPLLHPLLPAVATIPRLARRLPNAIGALLAMFTDHPDLTPWLQSEQDFFRLCRTVGAVLHGTALARFVDGDDIAALVDDLGHDAWRFGVEQALDAEIASADRHGRDHTALNRSDLTDMVLATGLRAVYRHLRDVIPDHLDDVAAALDLDWREIDGNGDAARDDQAVRRVLANFSAQVSAHVLPQVLPHVLPHVLPRALAHVRTP